VTDSTTFAEHFHDHFTRDPNSCLALGVERHLGDLPDPSLEAASRRVNDARELVLELATVPRDRLAFDDALDLELAHMTLQAEIHRDTYSFNGRTRLQQQPTAGDDIGDGIFWLFINDPRPAGDRLLDMTTRLEQVPRYVAALLARLEVPVARWVDVDRAKVAGLPQLLGTVRRWAEEQNFVEAARLGRAIEQAETALTAYVAELAQMKTTNNVHVGDATAREIVRLRGIELDLPSLHRIAREFLASTLAQIEELRERLVGKYGLPADASAERLEQELKRRFLLPLPNDSLDDIVARYELERERVLEFVQKHRLFPIPDDQDMLILRTPKFMEPSIPAGAMLSPAPFRSGTKRSIVYLTLSEELRAEHTELGIPMMMIHEGIPGHHLQLATAALHPSTIRRHVSAMDQAEGWTTMLEDYMLDIGYMGELTDEARFLGRHDISRIGARVAIDLFFMTGDASYLDVGVGAPSASGDAFALAGALLGKVTGFVPGRIQAELNWYSLERGYPLSYLAGNHLVWQLKRDVTAAQRGRLDGFDLDRKFHETFVNAGSMPVSYLRRHFGNRGLLGHGAAPL
jgi:uncharacterized protein (DUF885 family)